MEDGHWAAHLGQSSVSSLPSFTTESQLTPAQLCTRQKRKTALIPEIKVTYTEHSLTVLTEGPPALQWWAWQLHHGGGAWADTVGLSWMRSLNFCWWDQVCITTNSSFDTCRHLCRLSLFELSELTSLITSSKLSTCLLDLVPKSLLKEIWPLVNFITRSIYCY